MTGRKTTVRRASMRRKSTRSPSATRSGTPRSVKSEQLSQGNSFRASVEDLKEQTSPILPANNSTERITRSNSQSHRKSFADVASEQPRASLNASASEFVPVTLKSSRQSLNPSVRNSAADVSATEVKEATEVTGVKAQSVVEERVQSQVEESKTEAVSEPEIVPEAARQSVAAEASNEQANTTTEQSNDTNEPVNNATEQDNTANGEANTTSEVPVEGEGQVASQKAARCRCTIS